MFDYELKRVPIVGIDHVQTLIDKTRMNHPFNQAIQMEMDDAQTKLDELRRRQVPVADHQ